MKHIVSIPAVSSRRPRLVRSAIAGLALIGVAALTPACTLQVPGLGSALPAGPTASHNQPAELPPPKRVQPSEAPQSQAPNDVPGEQSHPQTSEGPAASEVPEVNDRASEISPTAEQDFKDAAQVTDRYWTEHWQDFFTGSFTSPRVLGMFDSQGGGHVPTCAGESLNNNASYSKPGNFVAWDKQFIAESDDQNTLAWIAIAHEWGHVVSHQLDNSLRLDAEESQADCFAGAALAGAEKDGNVDLGEEFSRRAVAVMNKMADSHSWEQADDHGDSFQRVESFNLGRTQGVDACLPN